MSVVQRNGKLAEGIDRLSKVTVDLGLNLQPGQQLIITNPDGPVPVEALPLVQRVTEHAYRAGASLVTTLFTDDASVSARLRSAKDAAFDVSSDWLLDGMARAFQEGAACLFLMADNPYLLAEEDQDKVSRASKSYLRARAAIMPAIFNMRTNWSLIPVATPAWAKAVFPHDGNAAHGRLWHSIFESTRVNLPDAAAAWQAHVAKLKSRAEAMNAKKFSVIRFSGPDTDLVVGLADRHTWTAATFDIANGARTIFNMPTEEINTIPDSRRVDGCVRMTKPLFFSGVVIEDITMRFEKGRVVDANARTNGEVLRDLLKNDENACRLGEVALVSHSSLISQSGILYYSTVLDENAASHIALGQAWSFGIQDGVNLSSDALAALGANQSMIHVDMMIGSGRVNVDGITISGETEPIMRNGEFVKAFEGN
jgi:aminopeptidase